MSPSVKKLISLSIKAVIIVLAYAFIYRSISNKTELDQFRHLIAQISPSRVYVTMAAVFTLMLVNWTLEAFKWKYLTRRLQKMSLWQSIEAVFCGLTWAIFTPNRLGEYGGRVLFLPPYKRLYGVFTMGIGSFGQNVTTNGMGAFAFIWFLFSYAPVSPIVAYSLSAAIGAFALFMVSCYFNMSWIVIVLKKIKPLRKYERFFGILSSYGLSDLARVLLFCLTRFAVFSTEYYLVIHLLIPTLPWFPVMMMVFNLFFIQSALPTLDLIDVGLRGTTAAVFFSYITTQKIAVIAAISSIWFINLIIPAVLGSIFVLKIKFFDRSS